MSTSTQAPDLGLNVKDSRNVKKKVDKEEIHVDICKNEVTRHHSHMDLGFRGVRPATENSRLAAKRSRCKRAANEGLMGMLYLLILAGIYMRYILATMEYHNVVAERDQLSTSLNEAQTKIINVTEERDELQKRCDTLAETNSFLRRRNMDLERCFPGYDLSGCHHLCLM